MDGRPLDVPARYGRSAPLVLDIGFGRGDATAALAAADPDRDVLAVEAHAPGVGRLLQLVEAHGLRNVLVAEGDAVELLRDMLPPAGLAEIRVWYPDPWPKARHAKRRMLRADFLDLAATRLVQGGRLHLASDAPGYVRQVVADLRAGNRFTVESLERPAGRPVTGYEQRALAAGRASYDVLARRI